MIKIEASDFLEAVYSLERVSIIVESAGKPALVGSKDEPIGDTATPFKEHLARLSGHTRNLGAAVTSLAIQEGIDGLESRPDSWTLGDIGKTVDEIKNTLRREMSLIHLFVVDRAALQFMEPDEPLFGVDVDRKFPSAAFEIDESGKCFALGRSTAAIFHQMRVMELGLRAIASCLGMQDPTGGQRNWGSMLKSIKDETIKRSSLGSWAQQSDKDFFNEVHASLDAVREAWRNNTMHVEKKYTKDEAEHIIAMVKGFMQKIASRCDETGQPKA